MEHICWLHTRVSAIPHSDTALCEKTLPNIGAEFILSSFHHMVSLVGIQKIGRSESLAILGAVVRVFACMSHLVLL